METLIDLLLIQLIVVFIIDISGVIDSIKYAISYLLTGGAIKTSDYRIKPLDCSLCMTFWTGLIYIIIIDQFTIEYIAFICLLSALTVLTKDIWFTISDTITKILNKINSL